MTSFTITTVLQAFDVGRGVNRFNIAYRHTLHGKSRVRSKVTVDSCFGFKVGHIGPKWDKSGAFSDQISLKSDLKKTRICPIWGQSDPLWSQTYHPWSSLSPVWCNL